MNHRPPLVKRIPSSNSQEYIPIDESVPPNSVWKIIILGLIGFTFFSSVWVFSEMPGSLSLSGESTWSSDQTWYAASHFCAIGVAALLVWLKR